MTANRAAAGPLISAFCALLIVLGISQPWIEFQIPIGDIQFGMYRGYDTTQGVVALIAALVGIALGFGAAFLNIPDVVYYFVAFLVAAVSIGATLHYWSVINEREGIRFFGQQIRFAETGIGIYVTIGAAIVYLISTIVQILLRLSQKDSVLE